MQIHRTIPFFLMLVVFVCGKEVNEREYEIQGPKSDANAFDDDFFEDDEEIDEEADESTELAEEEADDLPSEKDSPEEDDIAEDTSTCTKDQLEYFPNRLRDWFYIIMQESPKRKEVKNEEAPLLPIIESEESHAGRKWVDAVLWKFCELDKDPRDRQLSRDELSPLRNPLVSMEPCIDPFLANCDANNDHQITLQEWGYCLGLQNDEIKDEC